MRVFRYVGLLALVLAMAAPAWAQSTNTSSVVVVATDQSGAAVKDAKVTVTNTDTGQTREGTLGSDGSVTIEALPIVGHYQVSITKQGFKDGAIKDVVLRLGETAQLRVTLAVGNETSNVTVYGTTSGVRQDAQVGKELNTAQIDQTPILGRKIGALPLLDADFRSGKGTGDLFINSIYFVALAGGRREDDFIVDGATADEPWARQAMFSTMPIGAIDQMTIAASSFSAEYGWTDGPALNIVTKAGTNTMAGDFLGLSRPGGMQATSFSASELCPKSISTCQPVNSAGQTITAISPADTPDALSQGSVALGGALKPNTLFYFGDFDFTNEDRTAPLTTSLSSSPTYQGNYKQGLVDARVDDNLSTTDRLMARVNVDRFTDTNPQDAVSAAVLPSAARLFDRHTYTGELSETKILGSSMVNEARFEYQNGSPVEDFSPVNPSTQFTRGGSAPFTIGESRYADITSAQTSFSDTLSWTKGQHYLRLGGNVAYDASSGNGTEFGSAYYDGQFTFSTSGAAGTLPISALTLANVTNYTQSFSFCADSVPGNNKIGACIPGPDGTATYVQDQWIGAIFAQDSYRARKDLTLDLGLRYDKQTFADGDKNFAPRLGFAWNPKGDPRTVVRGSYAVYYTMVTLNDAPTFILGGPDGIFTYSATPGQPGFPTCLPTIGANGAPAAGCTPLNYNPNTGLSTLPARNITIRPGQAAYYAQDFATYGVNFNLLKDYPSALVDPKSQVSTIGLERQFAKHVFFTADYTHQYWGNLIETVDLNAPSVFVRTAPGQVRTAAAADATRPITPVNGGFREINTLENAGYAQYNGLSLALSYKGDSRIFASVSYTRSSAIGTTEPDGNGSGPNDYNQLGAQYELGPSLQDQPNRAVVTFSYRLPWLGLTAGTVNQFASGRPFNPTTGVDDNGDGTKNDRPVINGVVAGRDSFWGTPTYETDVFLESRIPLAKRRALTLRLEGFNIFNHANILSRNGTYGDTATASPQFGLPGSGTTAVINGVVTALPGLANIDPGRMFQLSARFSF